MEMVLKNIKPVNSIFNTAIKLLNLVLSKYNISALIILKRFFNSINTKVIFIVEDYDWVIKRVGEYITNNLKKLNLISAEMDRRFSGKNKIIHYSSISCLKNNFSHFKLDTSNKHILTYFHISELQNYTKFIPYFNKKLDLIHTSNNITRQNLVDSGLNENKIVVIPLGVDLSIFKQYRQELKIHIRNRYKLPQDRIVIGSFQKDGMGWGDGLKPKLIKGPDIFCEVVKKLNKEFKIHIFLTGPARGYVKEKLEEYKIPFTHIFLKNYIEIVNCYNALDLYIVSSRSEGGPLALLECMATGIPIITTKVGMAPEIITNNFNGFVAEIDDVDQLYNYSAKIINNNDLREKIITNGLKSIQEFSWEKISEQYYKKLYKNLLTE